MPVPARRAPENPILTPAMLRPLTPGWRVVGVFNPAVARVGDEVVLLLRVAEAPADVPEGEVAAPVLDPATGRLVLRRWRLDADRPDVRDPRLIVVGGRTWLTSISHLRVARSTDGVRFTVEPTPALAPATALEAFGVEDPRITLLDGAFWITYTAVSEHGIATALASTRDFRAFERHGVIFPPANRNVTILPERVGGRYAALHRPMPADVGRPAIWAAWSDDLRAWGGHRLVAAARDGAWDDAKVGGGAVPFRVRAHGRDAWLAIYHGVTHGPARADAHGGDGPPTYALGALLLDLDDPARVLARSREPILRPEAPYEREGFLGGVVFTCGALRDGDDVRIYYGAADGVVAVATLALADVLASLEPV